ATSTTGTRRRRSAITPPRPPVSASARGGHHGRVAPAADQGFPFGPDRDRPGGGAVRDRQLLLAARRPGGRLQRAGAAVHDRGVAGRARPGGGGGAAPLPRPPRRRRAPRRPPRP